MSNDSYLLVSYFVFAAVCLGLGILIHQILRKPFAAIADALTGKSRSLLLKRVLMLSLTTASVLGFLGVSYNNQGCMTYEQVVKERSYLVDRNFEQVQDASVWIVCTVLAWGVVLVICLKSLQKRSSKEQESSD